MLKHVLLLIKHSLVIFFIAISTFNACKKHIISKEKMITIITEMHLADAIKDRNNEDFYSKDSLSLYGSIFQKYNCSIDEFNSSMSYYIAKPEVMKDIYDEVILQLNKLKDNYSMLADQEHKEANLWKDADSLFIDTDSAYTKFEFNIPIKCIGDYQITNNIVFFDDDSTHNPKIEAWFASTDKIDTVVNKQELIIDKKDMFQNTLGLTLNDTSMNLLKGYMLNYDSISKNSKQHIKIKDIYIEFIDPDNDSDNKTLKNKALKTK